MMFDHAGVSRPHLRMPHVEPGMSVGLFGGSFNPPHDGHLLVAELALRRIGLDQLWWMVTPGNPLKENAGLPALRTRVAWSEAINDDPRVKVTAFEARYNVHYTAQTLALVKALNPGVRFVWIMGADNLKGFHRWARWRDILRTVPVAVVARPQDPIRARLSLTARTFSHARCNDNRAGALMARGAPGWTYLVEPLHKESSSRLRGEA